MKPTLLIIAATVALTGCGQKGPLYLPEEARDIVTRPAPPAAEPKSEPGETTGRSNSPGTADSPLPAQPAPEVTAPRATAGDADEDAAKKKKPPPPPQQN